MRSRTPIRRWAIRGSAAAFTAVALTAGMQAALTGGAQASPRQAPARLRYLGLMGSRRKLTRVRAELAERGVDLDGRLLHAPIGLRIGGDSPGEIAIAILAEVIGVRYESSHAS